ncbi:malto-oligosyltrehalose synthase, partial [bacterium]|nr:malto-oligosyltrehalose synthase [bacterium]
MRIPAATYRLQFNPAFDFSRASEILQYLHILGITDIYASPVFKAKQGSQHGYDVVDVNCISPELGGEVEMDKYISALHALGMGLILDIVPNHMAFDGENAMLMDVLENGHNSEYYDFFDIEWSHVYDSLSDRLLAPFLGQHYSEALNDREICLGYGENGFFIKYYDLCLPLKIESYVNVIAHGLGSFREKIGDDHPDLIKFLGILYSIKSLSVEQDERLGRYSQIKFIKKIMWELYGSNNTVREFIDANIAEFNGGDAGKGDMKLLDDLLSEQLFRLAFWKVATEELNYRRFFNINGLISLSMEKKKVFSLTHSLIFSLIKAHKIDGLRIDHIDGLYDPTVYLRRLREKAVDSYIVVEKILEPNEQLPSLWAVQGTTGYDYLNYANGVFCDVRNGRKFNRLYYGYTGFKTAYDVLLYQKKKIVIEKDMGGDVDNLAHLLKKIAGKSRYGTDMTMYGLRRATVKILANFPVYRTYINADSFSEQDREYIY